MIPKDTLTLQEWNELLAKSDFVIFEEVTVGRFAVFSGPTISESKPRLIARGFIREIGARAAIETWKKRLLKASISVPNEMDSLSALNIGEFVSEQTIESCPTLKILIKEIKNEITRESERFRRGKRFN